MMDARVEGQGEEGVRDYFIYKSEANDKLISCHPVVLLKSLCQLSSNFPPSVN